MEKSITVLRYELTDKLIEKIQDILDNAGLGDIYRTGENMNTFTFLAGEIKGKEVYASLKLTLHKNSYNLDDEIEKFEEVYAEKENKKKLKEEKKAVAAKEAERKEKKYAAIKAAKDLERARKLQLYKEIKEKEKES